MPFLTLGGTTYEVISIAEGKPEMGGGESVRSLNGPLRTTYKWQKRNFTAVLYELLEANYVTLYNALVLAPHISVGGDAISGGPLTCEVTLTGSPFVRWRNSWVRGISIEIRQA